MELLRRFGYYLIGMALGIPLVFFIWKGKGTTFDYGPNARTLKQLRIRKQLFSEEALKKLKDNNIDSTKITFILKNGDVDFQKSKPRKKPCAEFYVSSKELDLYIIRCDSTATIEKVFIK